jgi:hypothetical protein
MGPQHLGLAADFLGKAFGSAILRTDRQMMMPNSSDHTPAGWLAFELSVLRRLRFRSVVNPLAGEPDLDAALKRWDVRVAVNDPAQWAWIKGIARVENNAERLTEEDVTRLLEDVYVPGYRLRNPALARRFGETDAWWFDNLRASAEQLAGDSKQALALTLGMLVGDYALSFDAETRELRQPLARVFRRLWETLPAPVNNKQRNVSANKDPRQFIAEERGDLLFLRLPRAGRNGARRTSLAAWREEWVRGGEDFWPEHERTRAGKLDAPVETKQQYLRLVEDLLATATHIRAWAIAHVESGHVTTEELVETIRRVRKVETIYIKDFSELMGARAAIITSL